MPRDNLSPWSKLLKRLANDKRGTVAVTFGLGAVPMLLAGSMAVDMANASKMKAQLQAAVDSAVLAAATRLAVNASETDKEETAIETFAANISSRMLAMLTSSPVVDVDFPTKTVTMTATITTGTLVSSLITDELQIGVTASATISPGTPICMMALNPHQEKAINIQGTADLTADECAIHVNSDHEDAALYQTGTGTATAESFCVHGGYSGDKFTPEPRDRCMVENDPLATQFASDWAAAGIDSMPCDFTDLPQINTDSSTVTALEPGVYCGGLTIKQGIVQLETGGLYVFRDGPLHVQAQGTLQGTEVAVLFDGDDTTRLVTQAGADIVTSARTSGYFKGLAFAQDPDSVPASENLVIGGGEVQINGIMYFPAQPLKITGNGDIGTLAAQFAIIADTISIEGNGLLRIRIGQDYASAGLPELPEAQEVVYLID
jgi:Flp pilus assembly protein TadG